MLALSATFNSSTNIAYNRSGQVVVPFRSEPAQRIAPPPAIDASDDRSTDDPVSLSPEGLELSRQMNGQSAEGTEESDSAQSEQQSRQGQSASLQELAPEEQKVVQELKQRDQEVKTHEMAHLAVAGQYARGGASYTYQQGPDGRRYAVGGEVPVDLSEEKTPEETIQKMQTVRRAAMAPAEPSSADRSVAASAAAIASRAQQELRTEETETGPEQSAVDEAEDEATQSTGETAPADRPPAARSIDVVA